MKIRNYQTSVLADLGPREAVEKINRISAWWAKDFEGGARKLADVFTVHFGEAWITCQVVDVVQDEAIEWEIVDCHLPWMRNRQEWKETNLIWKLCAAGDSTRIDFVHVGLIPEVEAYEAGAKFWDFNIKESLLKWLTEGQGRPDEGQPRCAAEQVSNIYDHGTSTALSPCH